jgi:putative ABC transport system permease protein
MALWQKFCNVFRSEALNRELDEEFESHIDEAVTEGRDPEEARRAFGSLLRQREASRRFRVLEWLDGLRADMIFAARQLRRNRVTAVVAVVSLALAMGACVSAFRLIDALILRPLPITTNGRLCVLSRSSSDPAHSMSRFDGWAYPDFGRMRDAVKNEADLIAVSYTERTDLTYASDDAMEKGYVQYVSGSMFSSFGLQPALGRLFGRADDRTPGAHPVAVIAYDYWTRRFGRDPKVIGRTFRLGNQVFEIVGVGPKPFTGTEPGIMTDIFLPTMMNPLVTRVDATWHRTLAIMHPGASLEPLRAKLESTSNHFEYERLKGDAGVSKQDLNSAIHETLYIEPAASGVSVMQEDYRIALICLAGLVGLVLLIACANVANLMAALAAARTREMALRISIGAGRWRLMQLVLVESAMLAFAAALLGAAFAQWSAPWVAQSISTPDYPARFGMQADWRVLGFGVALSVLVMLLFGLAPSMRASSVNPASALKGGDDPHARHRLMNGLIAAQVVFCFLVVYAGGLFVATFHRLEHRPLGFDPSHLLLFGTVAPQGRMPNAWAQMADLLRSTPGVAEVAESGWPLVSSGAWNGSISVAGEAPSEEWGYFLTISPGWLSTMKLPLLAGRDFRPDDVYPGAAIVNQAFVKDFLKSDHPVGMTFEKIGDGGGRERCQVIGVVADAPYRRVREAILPVAFVPFRQVDGKGVMGSQYGRTFVVRTNVDHPMALAEELRRKVAQANAGFRVSDIDTQQGLLDVQTVRERLLARLGLFFAGVALLLASIGIYGVLNYSLLQRRREIGIRVALGAHRRHVAVIVAAQISRIVFFGAVGGCALGLLSARYLASLLYGVKAAQPVMLALPVLALLGITSVATQPVIRRALRIEPAEILRSQ